MRVVGMVGYVLLVTSLILVHPFWTEPDPEDLIFSIDEDTITPPPSVLEAGPKPDVPGEWVVYATGEVSCCDESGMGWRPVPVAVCVSLVELSSNPQGEDLTFWEVPYETGSVDLEKGDDCPSPLSG